MDLLAFLRQTLSDMDGYLKHIEIDPLVLDLISKLLNE
jgi:hypothetical protein